VDEEGKKRKREEGKGRARARRASTPEGIDGGQAAGRATFMGNRNAALPARACNRHARSLERSRKGEKPAPARRHGIRGEEKK